MVLNPRQKFIKRNFHSNAQIAATTIADQIPLPKSKVQLRIEIYKSLMTFMSAAFEMEKIIVKNSNTWDRLELGMIEDG